MNKVSLIKRLALTAAGFSALALAGSIGIAAAEPLPGPGHGTPLAVQQCRHDHFMHHKNHGKCVSSYQHYVGNGKPAKH